MNLNELLAGGIPPCLRNKIDKDYIYVFYMAAIARKNLDPSIIEEMDERLLKSDQEQAHAVNELLMRIKNSEPKFGNHEEEQIII